jgi:hypothetical protein
MAALVACITGTTSIAAHAHDLPWRKGDARQAGFGRCAKGPCTTRVVWTTSKPHLHANGKIVDATLHLRRPASGTTLSAQ